MSSEPLEYVPQERWTELQDIFKVDWPKNIAGYTLLETQKYLINNGFDYGFKVYCPYGNLRDGLVGINVKRKLCEIIILTASEDTTKLEEALKETKIIDWTCQMIIPFAPQRVIDCIEKAVSGRNVVIEYLPSHTYILERDSPPYTDISLPPNVTFGQLSSEHVDLVDSSWRHRYETSDWMFKMLIDSKNGYGLFVNKELVSWTLVNEGGALGHMFTLEEHRNKGYGALLLKNISNKLLAEGKDVFMYCIKFNVNASKLYRKVGFKNIEDVSWCFFNNIFK